MDGWMEDGWVGGRMCGWVDYWTRFLITIYFEPIVNKTTAYSFCTLNVQENDILLGFIECLHLKATLEDFILIIWTTQLHSLHVTETVKPGRSFFPLSFFKQLFYIVITICHANYKFTVTIRRKKQVCANIESSRDWLNSLHFS